MWRKYSILLLAVFLLLCTACQVSKEKSLLLVSKDYDNRFGYWPAMGDTTVKMVSLYHASPDSLDYYLSVASGIIISGGPDINPAYYGKEEETERCGKLDLRRDSLELSMINYAMENNIPLLCICRGEQILNVANKGSLIIDVPTDFDTTVNHSTGHKHMVRIVEGTLLSEIVGYDSGIVNTSHHQAVEIIAPGFRASAYAADGLIEAIEPVRGNSHPFILGVQWHPETMIRESQSPFTVAIAEKFMEAVHATKH